jgi:hypothetical protein
MASSSKILCAECGYPLLTNTQVPSFPVPDLIHKPRVPSSFEANLIQRTLSGVRSNILRLDDMMQQLQDIMQKISIFREGLSTYVKEYEAVLSPIERLPPELLSEIFLHLHPPSWDKDSYGYYFVPRDIVMLPAQICRRWRRVALSTPNLYTTITIGGRHGSLDSELALTKTWLSRSGTLPLSLAYQPPAHPKTEYQPVIDEVLAHSNRWRNLSITFTISSFSNLAAVRGRLHCLEKLEVSLRGVQMQPVDAFETAPQLRSLSIDSDISLHFLTIPWVQLANLDITYPGFGYPSRDCLDVLSRCPNLVTCSLVLQQGSAPVTQCHPIELLHLRSLYLEGSEPADIFVHLSLPALHNCHYFDGDWASSHSWNHREFTSFLSRTRCSLVRLVLDFSVEFFPKEFNLISTLEHVPNLAELEVPTCYTCEFWSLALSRLTVCPSDNGQVACLAPKLKFLKLSPDSIADHWAFIDMIQSRLRLGEPRRDDGSNAPVQRIEKVAFESYEIDQGDLDRIGQDVLERYWKMRGEGLEIDFYGECNFEEGYFCFLEHSGQKDIRGIPLFVV